VLRPVFEFAAQGVLIATVPLGCSRKVVRAIAAGAIFFLEKGDLREAQDALNARMSDFGPVEAE